MLFKNVTFLISVILAKSKIILSVLIFDDYMKKHHLNLMKILVQHQVIIANIMISLFCSFANHINIIVENLLKIQHHAVLNEKIKNSCTNVKKEEKQCTMLQIRMKVAEYESSFIIFIEFQFIINDVKVLQKQQNYLKMYI